MARNNKFDNEFRICWWNTGCSPNAKQNRATPQEFLVLYKAIDYIFNCGAHLLILCEFSENDVAKTQEQFAGRQPSLGFYALNRGEGRSKFDAAILYRTDAIEISSELNLIFKRNGSDLRIGQQFVVSKIGTREPFHVIASHWSSRLWLDEYNPMRNELAGKLRDKVDQILEDDADANLVLIGDYNDEPFNSPIAQTLLATRSFTLAQQRPSLLYNPFWRHLSCYEHRIHRTPRSSSGTYFHKTGKVTQWRTFDHMMISGALASGRAGWVLDEHMTRPLDPDFLIAAVTSTQTNMDHLPIMGRFRRTQ